MIMMSIAEDDYSLITEYAPIKAVFVKRKDANYEISEEHLEELLLEIDDAIIEHGMVNQNHLNKLGGQLQRLYDKLVSI